MTRQEELVQAARKEYPNWEEARCHFIDGAHYADAHPHWISVEEQDIPLGQWVITYAPNEINYCKIDVELLAMDETAEDFGITHWMPLPSLPSSSEIPNNCEEGGDK